MKVISTSICVALAQSELDESGLLQHQTSARKAATMRGDDVYSYDNAGLSCVDCPEFVALSAAAKKGRVWAHIISDEYKHVNTEDRPWLQTYTTGEKYKCYGKERQNSWKLWSRRRPVGSWQSVTGQRTCERQTCDCSDDFPNGKAWLDPTTRFKESQGRVTNGTQPMFVDRFSDVNPAGNLKTIHSFGAVAQAKVVTTRQGRKLGYTGMFLDGFKHGLLRLSMVTDFSKATCQPSDKACQKNGPSFTDAFKPSLALKMFRDEEESSNLVAQVNLGMGVGHKANEKYGMPAWENSLNFFKFTQATWLPKPEVAVVGNAALAVKAQFAKAVDAKEIGGVGIKELAAHSSKEGKTAKAPPMIFFVPTAQITRMKFSDADHDARHDFQKIRAGTPIYKIVALAEDDGCFMDNGEPYYWETLPKGCQGLHLGTVVTSSVFVASDWGDRRLFFQHERLQTKNGVWQRTMCSTKDGSKLPDTSEFRMASDLTKTCSVVFKGKKCGRGMVESKGASAVCPYAYMDEDSA